jgi:hypothetical protein
MHVEVGMFMHYEVLCPQIIQVKVLCWYTSRNQVLYPDLQECALPQNIGKFCFINI